MKKISWLFVAIGVISITGIVYIPSLIEGNSGIESNQMTQEMMMQDNMMNEAPQDVIVKVKSSQVIQPMTESTILLEILDKKTGNSLEGAAVIIGIEKGASMTTMNMVGPMFSAHDMGNGIYSITINPAEKGIYTLHTHVIPQGKSMHSMMNNHLDIGIIVE